MTNSPAPVNYLKPFLTLVFLFLVIGFLTTANGQFQAPLQTAFPKETGALKNTLATLISFSWFLAYPIAGKWGGKWVSVSGYKTTLLKGLFLMLAGLLVFFLSSLFTSRFPQSGLHFGDVFLPTGFFIFLAGSFISGAAATVLQVVINPYLSACYVRGTQPVQRLVIGGSANAVGSTIAPFFVAGVVFGNLSVSDVKIEQLHLPFLVEFGIMALVTLLIVKLALPDIEGTRAGAREKLEHSVWSFRHFRLGVIAIFCYVGVEVAVGANINLYVLELEQQGNHFTFLGKDHFNMLGQHFTIPALMATLYWGGTLVGRLASSTLKTTLPRTQLLFVVGLAVIFSLLTLLVNNPWLLVGMGLAHSIMWGAIYTLSVAHLGKYTPIATGAFMIGVLGGAIIPLLQGGLADLVGSWRFTWVLVLIGELYILYYGMAGYKVREHEVELIKESLPLAEQV